MSQGDSYGGDEYPTEQYAPYPPEQPAEERSSKVSVPTILASAGVAAVISSLIVTIGVVGMVISNNNSANNSSAPVPTVVNLGAAQSSVAPGAPGAPGAPAQPGTQAGTEAPLPPPGEGAAAGPTEDVGSSGGGSGPPATQAPPAAAPQAAAPTQTQAPQQTQQAAAPQPLTPGQLNTKVNRIMDTNASRASRADELQGGARALPGVDAVAQMLRVSGAGFTYEVVGPVTQNGNTLNARLQMSLVGNGSRYLNFSWVWMDGKWKLSNQSVCAVAAYAMLPCPVG